MHGEAHCMSQATFREVLLDKSSQKTRELLRIAVSEVNSQPCLEQAWGIYSCYPVLFIVRNDKII